MTQPTPNRADLEPPRMNVLVIEPGHGSTWLTNAVFVDRFGKPNPKGRFVTGDAWTNDGGWNMPDDYTGHSEPYTTYRRRVLRVEPA